MTVSTACADDFLRFRGVDGEGRRDLQDAVVATHQREAIDWIERSREWKWTWPGGQA